MSALAPCSTQGLPALHVATARSEGAVPRLPCGLIDRTRHRYSRRPDRRTDRRQAVRGASGDRSRAAFTLQAERASMGMGWALLEGVAEHVVDQAQQRVESP